MARAQERDWMKPRPAQGQDRPTGERIARGSYRAVATEDAGIKYALDDTPDNAARIHRKKWITDGELEAAHKFQEMAHGMLGSPCQRSCLDNSPVGHDGEDTTGDQEKREAAREAEWRGVRACLLPGQIDALLDAFWQEVEQPARVPVQQGLARLCARWQIRG